MKNIIITLVLGVIFCAAPAQISQAAEINPPCMGELTYGNHYWGYYGLENGLYYFIAAKEIFEDGDGALVIQPPRMLIQPTDGSKYSGKIVLPDSLPVRKIYDDGSVGEITASYPLKGIGAAFIDSDVEEITFNEFFTLFDDGAVFENTPKLTTLIFPYDVRITFIHMAFTHSNISKIIQVENATNRIVIAERAFKDSFTEKLDLSNLSNAKLLEYMLDGSNIKEIIIRSDATYESGAFRCCPSLESIYYKGDLAPTRGCVLENNLALKQIVLDIVTPPDNFNIVGVDYEYDKYGYTRDYYNEVTLYVPDQSVDVYRNHEKLSKFKNIRPQSEMNSVAEVEVERTVLRTEVYDLQGRPVTNPDTKGLLLERTIYNDGTASTRKVIR